MISHPWVYWIIDGIDMGFWSHQRIHGWSMFWWWTHWTHMKLVGGLEHFLFSIYWEYNPKWLIFFQRGWNHQPGKLCFFCHKMSCSRRRLRRLPLQRTWCQRGCGPISGVYGESTVSWTPDDPTPYFVEAVWVKHWDRWSYHLQFVDTLSVECVACMSAFSII